MDGNELAGILNPGEPGRLSIPWASEYWETERPTFEGYREWYKRRYGRYPEEKLEEVSRTVSDTNFMADILSSKDYMMLSPLDRAKVVETAQKFEIQKEQQEEGRKAKAILQSSRVPADKVTALTMVGIPLSDARDMVWGKREPEERVERERATPARARPEELAEVLRPEPRGVQFRMVGGELIKEPAGVWEPDEARRARIEQIDIEGRRLKAEKKTEEKEAREQAATWWEKKRQDIAEATERDRARAEKEADAKRLRIKEVDELGEKLADKRYKQRIEQVKYEDERGDIDKKYELDVAELGEEKAKNLRDYELESLIEKHKWEETLFDMGFEDKEFQELSKRFWGTLDFNKEKEEIRAKEFDIELEWKKEEETNVMVRFKKTLQKEYKQLDLDVKKFGLNKETETRIREIALLKFGLDVKELGEKEAARKWEEIEAKKEWWFKEKELPFKEVDTLSRFLTAIKGLAAATGSDGFAVAVNKFLANRLGEDVMDVMEELEKQGKAQMEVPAELSTDLSTLGVETTDKVMEFLKSAYNPKTKKIYQPTATEKRELGKFFLGDDQKLAKEFTEEERKKLGCNLSGTDCIEAVIKEPFWSDALKGLVIRMRYNEDAWTGIQAKANTKKLLILPEGEPSDLVGLFGKIGARLIETIPGLGIAKKGIEWLGWGKEKVATPVPAETLVTEDIKEVARRILREWGVETTEAELRGALRKRGYPDEDIDRVIRGM